MTQDPASKKSASSHRSKYFPPLEEATEEGLLCFGGTLEVDWLMDAYRHAIFPWPIFEDEGPVAWWSLDPRAIFEMEGMYISKRLRRTIRSQKYQVTCDQDFAGVIRNCANGPGREGGCWITSEMVSAYQKLHAAGYAHSIEVWYTEKSEEDLETKNHTPQLVGGLYGVEIGGIFAAESMFHLMRDASKVALAYLMSHLKTQGFGLVDTQQLTEHTASLGGIEITRQEYLRRLYLERDRKVFFGSQLSPYGLS